MKENNTTQKELEFKTVTPAPILLYWDRKVKGLKSRYFYNCETEKGSHTLSNVIEEGKSYSVIQRRSRIEYGYGIQLDKENNTLSFAVFSADTRGVTKNSKPANKIGWKSCSNLYSNFSVSKDKMIVDSEGCKKPSYQHSFFWSNDYPHDVRGYENVREDNFNNSNSIKTFEDYFGRVFQLSGNKSIRLYSIGDVLDMLKYKEPQRKSGPKQKLVDILTSKTNRLDVKVDELETDKNSSSRHAMSDNKYSVLEKVNTDKPCCVLRTFTVVQNSVHDEYVGYNYFNEYQNKSDYDIQKDNKLKKVAVEGARIYFYGKEVICCKPNNFGDYISMPLFKNKENWENKFISYEESIAKGTKLEYLTSILKNFETSRVGYAIWAFTENPIFEQLYKAGYRNIVTKCLCLNKDDSPISYFEKIFGETNTSGNLHSRLGLNKHQLCKINEYMNSTKSIREDILNNIKKIFIEEMQGYVLMPKCNISNIDDKTFDFVLNAYLEYEEYYANPYNIKNSIPKYIKDINLENIAPVNPRDYAQLVGILYHEYGLRALENMQNKVLELCIGTINDPQEERRSWWHSSPAAVKTYKDYLNMAKLMNENSKMPYNFETCTQLKDMHDSLAIIYNQHEQKFKEEAFAQRLEKLNQYVYENDTCMVVAPNGAADLVVEGNELRHCVKSYIQKIIDGYTNVMFIRKKNEPDKPFFTVEISNDGQIEQVHGFANCNANSDPLVSDFMKDWLKTKRVSAHEYNKVR